MEVKLVTCTPDPEATIIEIARASSSRKNKREKIEGLVNYLIKHKHWSPFEHAYMTVQINTSKAIGIQLIRHRSFTFQEFSQRYQDVRLLSDQVYDDRTGSINDFPFEKIEFRKQAKDNRQSSEEVIDPKSEDLYGHEYSLSDEVYKHLKSSSSLYDELLKAGVAREVARMVLPMATKTKIYMTGSARSWIHFLSLRDDSHAQKEIQDVAKEIKKIFINQFPITAKSLGYDNREEDSL